MENKERRASNIDSIDSTKEKGSSTDSVNREKNDNSLMVPLTSSKTDQKRPTIDLAEHIKSWSTLINTDDYLDIIYDAINNGDNSLTDINHPIHETIWQLFKSHHNLPSILEKSETINSVFEGEWNNNQLTIGRKKYFGPRLNGYKIGTFINDKFESGFQHIVVGDIPYFFGVMDNYKLKQGIGRKFLKFGSFRGVIKNNSPYNGVIQSSRNDDWIFNGVCVNGFLKGEVVEAKTKLWAPQYFKGTISLDGKWVDGEGRIFFPLRGRYFQGTFQNYEQIDGVVFNRFYDEIGRIVNKVFVRSKEINELDENPAKKQKIEVETHKDYEKIKDNDEIFNNLFLLSDPEPIKILLHRIKLSLLTGVQKDKLKKYIYDCYNFFPPNDMALLVTFSEKL